MVVEVNNQRRSAFGWEGGVHGVALRQIEPIFYQGNYAGALEVGMFLDERILTIWKNAVLGDWYLCRTDGSSKIQLAGTGDSGCDLSLSADERRALESTDAFVRSSNNLLIQRFPIVDFSGKINFYIKRVIDVSPIRTLANEQRSASIWLGLWVLTIASLIFAFLIRSVLKPLDDLISHAQAISDGDLEQPISSKTPDEIGGLSRAFEGMRQSLKQKTAELEAQSALFRTLAETASEWILWLGPDGDIIYSSPSCKRITGLSSSEMQAKTELLTKIVHPEDREAWRRFLQTKPETRGHKKEQFRIVGPQEETRWILCRTSTVLDADQNLLGLRCSITDITAQKQAEAHLKHMSFVDPLTGAYNRAFFDDSVQSLARDEKWPVTVIVADMDRLKEANDSFGHHAGDELLKGAAEVMRKCLRKEDILARIGGDEFVILMPETQSRDAEAVITRIESAIADFNSARDSNDLEISFGVACGDGIASGIEAIIETADQRMYRNKRQKKLKR
jgi:diguanylate cyclase (GGDEF)-like protein/PAS domain S-box-containing protein